MLTKGGMVMRVIRIKVCLILAMSFALATQSCGDDDATVCNNCECMVEGDPCPPRWLEFDCLWSGQGAWCGETIHASGGCECLEEVWTCHEPGPDPGYCHDCCQAAEDDASTFCATNGTCVEAILCEAESCCVPGTSGDTYCVGAFGEASSCVAHETGGTCSETP